MRLPCQKKALKTNSRTRTIFLKVLNSDDLRVRQQIKKKNPPRHSVSIETMLYAGDFFGEGALLRGEPRNASAIATTPCSLYELIRSDLEQLFKKQPSIKKQIISIDHKR